MNDEKRYIEALKLVGEKDLMEEFDEVSELHVFSDKYKRQKKALLIKGRSERAKLQKKKRNKTIKTLIASAAALILLPITVFAAYKFYTIRVTDRNYAKEVNVEEVTGEIKPVEMKIAYLPEGMLEFETGKYRNENEEKWLSFMLIKVDTDAKFMLVDVEDKQEIELSNHTSVLLGRKASAESENYHAAIFYDQQGYIVEIWSEGIEETELMKIFESISLEETTSKGTYAVSLESQTGDADTGKGTPLPVEDTIVSGQVYEMKETFIYETVYNVYETGAKNGKLEISVEDVVVLDNISGIREDSKVIARADQGIVDETGKLLPYERQIGEWGDGIENPVWKTNETQMINRKILSVSVRMKNMTGEAAKSMNIFPRLSLLTEKNGSYQWLEEAYREFNNNKEAYAMDIYGTGNGGKGFYFVDFEKDEEKQITITFLVDEDELEHVFFSYQNDGGAELGDYYVDIRQ